MVLSVCLILLWLLLGFFSLTLVSENSVWCVLVWFSLYLSSLGFVTLVGFVDYSAAQIGMWCFGWASWKVFFCLWVEGPTDVLLATWVTTLLRMLSGSLNKWLELSVNGPVVCGGVWWESELLRELGQRCHCLWAQLWWWIHHTLPWMQEETWVLWKRGAVSLGKRPLKQTHLPWLLGTPWPHRHGKAQRVKRYVCVAFGISLPGRARSVGTHPIASLRS